MYVSLKGVFLLRYMSDKEKDMVTKVILSLENVQYLSIQAVATNDLGNALYLIDQVLDNSICFIFI